MSAEDRSPGDGPVPGAASATGAPGRSPGESPAIGAPGPAPGAAPASGAGEVFVAGPAGGDAEVFVAGPAMSDGDRFGRPGEPEKIVGIDSEYLSGRRFPYQEDPSLLEDVDLLAATPGEDINWLEDIELLQEDGVPAVFDRYSNSFLKIYFDIPAGHEDEIARKVLIKHLQSGNSYGISLKERHTKFAQPELGPWVKGSRTVGADWSPPVLEGWEPPAH